ncbi:proheparin-binding EGF-like growth factor isoform X1 [Polyodon spathula]|uniref:proheparin-binding EGF-like growth factor isoform X1 n=2 Tax=Polyodon spathula TaxID=7913 RepID=UPI001B7E8CD8|nr:proheparin-binding EGF-like growth factor isoform X1 [Polyodon spathula]
MTRVTFVLVLFHAAVFCSLVKGAAIERFETNMSPSVEIKEALRNKIIGDDDYDYDYDSSRELAYEEEPWSGDYGIEFPRVAFSTKPLDLSTNLNQKQGKKRKGKGGKKGKGKKRDMCQGKYKDFCIHGECKYIRDLKAPSCICQQGYMGERCHLFSLPVVKNNDNYDKTTVLAVVAMVLSSMCLIGIAALLALRFHKRGAYDVENEEKVKLGTATNL